MLLNSTNSCSLMRIWPIPAFLALAILNVVIPYAAFANRHSLLASFMFWILTAIAAMIIAYAALRGEEE